MCISGTAFILEKFDFIREPHTSGCFVHCEPQFEAIWMSCLYLLQLILQQNVLLRLENRRKYVNAL